MNNLSDYQKNLLLEVYSKGLYIVSNEGVNYKCWLEDKKGLKLKTVNRRTVGILFDEGYIVPLKNDTKNFNLYHYELSDKTLNYIKRMNMWNNKSFKK